VHRDRVGPVVFQKDRARVVLPPTNSVELAQKALKDIPVGGKTPPTAGVDLAHHVIQQELRLHRDVMPLMIVLTDGAANVAMTEMPAQKEAYRFAELIHEDDVRAIVIYMEHAAFDQGLAASWPNTSTRCATRCAS
jgi:Mg-chelatase subunit ChlD